MYLELLAGRNGSDQPAQVACATGKSFTHHGKGTAFSLYRKRLARPPLPRALNARAQDWAGAHRLHAALGLQAHFRNVNTGAAVFFFSNYSFNEGMEQMTSGARQGTRQIPSKRTAPIKALNSPKVKNYPPKDPTGAPPLPKSGQVHMPPSWSCWLSVTAVPASRTAVRAVTLPTLPSAGKLSQGTWF